MTVLGQCLSHLHLGKPCEPEPTALLEFQPVGLSSQAEPTDCEEREYKPWFFHLSVFWVKELKLLHTVHIE